MTPKDQLKEVALILGLPVDSKDVVWMLAEFVKQTNSEISLLRKKLAIAEMTADELAETLRKMRDGQVKDVPAPDKAH